MDVKVTIHETKTFEKTYIVRGVNSLENASKCAMRCSNNMFQPNTKLKEEKQLPTVHEIYCYEVID